MNIIKKWDKTGLLEGLRSADMKSCAILLEDVAHLLISKKDNNDPYATECWLNATCTKLEFIAGTLLPVCRRIFSEKLTYIPTAQKIYNSYNSFLITNNFNHLPPDLIYSGMIDKDEEIILKYMEHFKNTMI
jgi:hypothetical protein